MNDTLDGWDSVRRSLEKMRTEVARMLKNTNLSNLTITNLTPINVKQVELDLSDPVEMIEVNGWRLQFIPSEGDFAGQPITRVFISKAGRLGEAKRICKARYGADTHILAGAALHYDSKFGVWDGE